MAAASMRLDEPGARNLLRWVGDDWGISSSAAVLVICYDHLWNGSMVQATVKNTIVMVSILGTDTEIQPLLFPGSCCRPISMSVPEIRYLYQI